MLRNLILLEDIDGKAKFAQDITKNWIEKYDGRWLTVILIPGVKLDNNVVERGLLFI